MNKYKFLLVVSYIIPVSAHGYFEGVNGWIAALLKLVDYLSATAFGLCLFAFFWGVAKYIFSAGDEKSMEVGRRIMVGGTIALFVISSIWGIKAWISSSLGINNTISSISVPTIN